MNFCALSTHPAVVGLMPFWLLLAGGTALLLLDLLPLGRWRRGLLLAAAGVPLLSSAWLLLRRFPAAPFSFFQGSLVLDKPAIFLCGVVLLIAGAVFLFSSEQREPQAVPPGERYALLSFSAAGMMLLVAAQSLALFFLGLELMSLPLYVLSAGGGSRLSDEAAFKYFLLGAFSSALLLMGIAFLYGASGTLLYSGLTAAAPSAAAHGPATYAFLGLGFVIAGLGFKVAAVPFHMWAPDVYQGAPASITAFMASGVKVAAFAAAFRLLNVALAPLSAGWSGALYWICLATMVWGNLAALAQKNVKRMLAYSSIAHAGYLLIALVINNDLAPLGEPAAALFFYLAIYSLMTLGTFGAVWGLEQGGQGSDFEDFSGLAARQPTLAFALAVMLFSLAGFPPCAGFFAKFYLFSAALGRGAISLVLVAILMSLVSVAYYLRLIYFMYMRPPQGEEPRPRPATAVTVLILAGLVLGVGLFPAGWVELLGRVFGAAFY